MSVLNMFKINELTLAIRFKRTNGHGINEENLCLVETALGDINIFTSIYFLSEKCITLPSFFMNDQHS